MSLFAIVVAAQLAVPARATPPVLTFPEPGLDDTAAYPGYRTRLFRDVRGNTVQIYVDGRDGRVVHLWANADNESLGFTARNARGAPATLGWSTDDATVAAARGLRSLEHHLVAESPAVTLGAFLLGSMRLERDYQHVGHHRKPFADAGFALPEIDRLLAALERLPVAERRRHLASLAAPDIPTLRARLRPVITIAQSPTMWTARVLQRSLDGRDSLLLEVHADPRRVTAMAAGDSVMLRARSGDRVPFSVRVATSADPLAPLAREEIFTRDFLAFLDSARAAGERGGRAGGGAGDAPDSAWIRARWLERQVRGVELLSSREKLMAGLPNYGTYFGRDMLVSALMMRPIWRGEMAEHVIASVLRKLSPTGQVSHEEALGGQAVREAAAEYAGLMEEHARAAAAGDRTAADSLLARARTVLAEHRRVRENYHMIDDEFQLPVLVARWITDSTLSAERKRRFLLEASDGEPRLVRLVRELGLVARLTADYVREPVTANLVSFPPREGGWASTSWRDSGAGYAGGRYAMDVNAIWVPHALESIGTILDALRSLGLMPTALERARAELAPGTPLGTYAREAAAVGRAVDVWRGAARHFLVGYHPGEIGMHVALRMLHMPQDERDVWGDVWREEKPYLDSLVFLALALDGGGQPIAVANTDPATGLFLGPLRGSDASAETERFLRDVRLFVREYPVGLFIDRVGPVVANDAYADAPVWSAFERDHYHGPRVVWGREVNLFLLGLTNALADPRSPLAGRHGDELRAALAKVLGAVEASGFQSELWSYEIRDGRVVPVRYGTGSDVQLWSTTDLAVQYALSRLRP